MWDEIRALVEGEGHMAGVDRSRSRIDRTAEIFTPAPLVVQMLQRMPLEAFAPGKDVLDPACGDGNFLVAAKAIKMLAFDMDERAALDEIFGVDIMRDNVDRARERLGGGHIVMGDTLSPSRRLTGQTEQEHRQMLEWFTDQATSF